MKIASSLVLMSMALLPTAAEAKSGSITITAAMRATAQANAARYPWARKIRDAAVKAAQPWLERSDEELWRMVTPQSLPRTIHTTLIRGTNRTALCPKCGDGIVPFGNYPWKNDAKRQPWKLRCPNCQEVFPKNDFWAYYLSALDKHGKFQPGQGDRKLLFNTDHPDPKDPLHKYGVDDGYGWYDADQTRFAFVAYYNSWVQWANIYRGLEALARAYTLTGDVLYAHKAGVLLDRVADVYPEMDLYEYIAKMKFEHSDGSSAMGRIEGSIWECGVARRLALAYDQVYDGMVADATLPQFLQQQARQFGLGDKGSFAAIQANIEEHLLLEIVQGVRDGRIRGNEGMHQVAMATAAIALDRQPLTNELLDWIFAPGQITRSKGRRVNSGGNIPYVLVEKMDRDGMGSEGAPGYSCWGTTLLPLAQVLDLYPAYTRHNLFRDFPKYKQCFLTPVRWLCLGQTTPPIGDSGACGAWAAVGPGREPLLDLVRIYRDPLLAARLLDLYGDPQRIPGDIYAEQPDSAVADLAHLASARRATPAVNLNGFGLAIAQSPEEKPSHALWMYYGRNSGHGHRDRLNIGLYAKNLDLLPDLGYPEYASGRPMDVIWERNSIAHNVVIVDDQPQRSSYTGHLRLLEGQGRAQVIEVESPEVFASAKTYRRLSALIQAGPGEAYVVDLFRVVGGSLHRQSWHGPAATATAHGLRLTPQSKGTFAGEEVAFGQLPEKWKGSPGYMYLYDVRRDANPPALFSLDYKAEDRRKRIAAGAEPHLRLTCLTACAEVALAHGNPPHNKSGNPRQLDYAVLTRRGQDLQSLFATIVEPYDKTPIIRQVRALRVLSETPDPLAAAIEVTLADGRVDTILSCPEPARLAVEGNVTLEGTFGIVARRGAKVEFAKLVAGTRLVAAGIDLRCPAAFVSGKVLALSAEKPDDNFLVASLSQEAETGLVGRLAIVANDAAQDAAYTIRELSPRPEGWKIGLGDSTLVRGFKNPQDFSAGYTYNVRVEDALRIPLSAYQE